MKLKFLTLLVIFIGFCGFSQENISYQTPPKEIMALADFDRAPSISMDKDREYILFSYVSQAKSSSFLSNRQVFALTP